MLFDDLLAISFISGVGDKTLKKVSQFETARQILELTEDELYDVFHYKKTAEEFANHFDDYRELTKQKRKALADSGAYVLHCDNSKYPQRLLAQEEYPTFLFCKGNLELLNSTASAAISGPRKASPQGLDNAARTATQLNRHCITVVSGLAVGIDTAAHTACLNTGNTIAVLPFFAPVYPQQNAELAQDIINRGGLVVSRNYDQFNIKYQLLSRDKVIVGMSDALYVPDAFSTDSGTAYTVNLALEAEKTVYTYKNSKYQRLSK